MEKKDKTIFGLVGKKLGHSFSKDFFSKYFEDNLLHDITYDNFELANAGEIRNLVKNIPNIQGLNITIPYKPEVMVFLDEIDADAKEIGAVNTIAIIDGKMKGYNTDHLGFSESLKPLLNNFHKRALILGDGGASKAVAFALENLGIPYLTVSRNPTNSQLSYHNITKKIFEENLIVINCTPLGTFPKIDEHPPIPYEFFTKKHLAYDLIYNPLESGFLRKAAAKGSATKNGLQMLQIQAMESWKIWNSTL